MILKQYPEAWIEERANNIVSEYNGYREVFEEGSDILKQYTPDYYLALMVRIVIRDAYAKYEELVNLRENALKKLTPEEKELLDL